MVKGQVTLYVIISKVYFWHPTSFPSKRTYTEKCIVHLWETWGLYSICHATLGLDLGKAHSMEPWAWTQHTLCNPGPGHNTSHITLGLKTTQAIQRWAWTHHELCNPGPGHNMNYATLDLDTTHTIQPWTWTKNTIQSWAWTQHMPRNHMPGYYTCYATLDLYTTHTMQPLAWAQYIPCIAWPNITKSKHHVSLIAACMV